MGYFCSCLCWQGTDLRVWESFFEPLFLWENCQALAICMLWTFLPEMHHTQWRYFSKSFPWRNKILNPFLHKSWFALHSMENLTGRWMVQNYESPLENYMVVSCAAEFLEAFAMLHSYSHFGPNIFLKQFQSPFLSYVTCMQTNHKRHWYKGNFWPWGEYIQGLRKMRSVHPWTGNSPEQLGVTI